jgi:DNA-binding NarL/FixJ family response regulator
MAKGGILWDTVMLADFRCLACLTEDEDKVLTAWAKGWSNVKMADQLGMSDRTVSRHLESLREKYDAVQVYSPLLPPRK